MLPKGRERPTAGWLPNMRLPLKVCRFCSLLWRIFITKEIYAAAGLLAGIALLLNVALYFFGNSYANTSFSYSNLVANPMVFAFMGMIIPFLFYEGGK